MPWEGEPGSSAVGRAAAAVEAWNALVAAVRAGGPGNHLDLARMAVAAVLTPSAGRPTGEGPVAALAEQFTADVSGVTGDQRAAALGELGPSALAFVQAVWVCDLGARARRALEELFGEPLIDDAMVAGPTSTDPAWDAQERFLREVARLQALDAVTSELVRLRGARAHGCRLCQSLRNRTAVEAADHPGLFEGIDGDAGGDVRLTEAQQAALALVDAMVWQPMAWPVGLAERLRRSFSPDEALELVMDVVRNAANKIAVAFGADAPHVTDGVEYYDIDPHSGELVYGLAPVEPPVG